MTSISSSLCYFLSLIIEGIFVKNSLRHVTRKYFLVLLHIPPLSSGNSEAKEKNAGLSLETRECLSVEA